MIYSRFRPDTGGYDYFETDERYALSDDLPTPSLFSANPIGVSSLVCGRKIPAGARPAGSGQFAKGVIAPLDRSGLSGNGVLGGLGDIPIWAKVTGGLALVAFSLYWWYIEPKGKRA